MRRPEHRYVCGFGRSFILWFLIKGVNAEEWKKRAPEYA